MVVASFDGRKFALLRQSIGYTQAEVADEFGCSLNHIAKIEVGMTKLRPVYALALRELVRQRKEYLAANLAA